MFVVLWEEVTTTLTKYEPELSNLLFIGVLAGLWRKLMCCNKSVDIIEFTYMSGGRMVGKYSSYLKAGTAANCKHKVIKRGNECATTASNFRKTLLNVSVMLQCTANTAWSQVTLSVKHRERRRRYKGELLNSLGVPLPNRLLLSLSWTKAIFTIPVTNHHTSQN